MQVSQQKQTYYYKNKLLTNKSSDWSISFCDFNLPEDKDKTREHIKSKTLKAIIL
jgi:hypothetical protein